MKRFSVRYPSSSSITTRFILTFSLLFVAIFSISIWIFIHGLPGSSFSGWFGDEKNQAIRTLNSLADMQKTRLLQMFDHLRQDARLLAQDHFMREKLETLFSDHLAPQDALNPWPSNDPYGPYLEAWLREFQSQYSFYQAIHIVRIDTGQAILSTQPKIVNQILLDPVFSARILATRQDYIGGFAPSATPTSFLVGSPIFLAQENPAAVVVLVVSLQQFLQPVQSTAIGPWHSMETILVNERGVNLFRPGPPKNFAYHTPGSSDSVTLLPSRIAASGQEGFIETKDQNNVSVLAGYRHIRLFSEWRWGLVIQIGRDDLLQPMSTAYEFAWAIGFVSTAGFVIVAFILTRRLTHPLRQLTEAAHRLTAGQRHVRSQHQGKDEVGVLAKAFDTMADEVARTLDHLERTVTHRTVALAQELEIRKQQQREQQSIEMFLKESEQRYRSLVDTMTAGVAVYEAVEEGQDFIIRDINRMGEHLTQLEKKDVIGQLVTKVFPSVKEFGLFDVFQRVYQTAIPANHPMTICSHHRLKQWFENRIYKLPSGEIVAIFDDISERKIAEDALKMVLFSVDNTHDAFIWLSREGQIMRTNRATSTMLGYPQEALLTLRVSDIVADMSPEAWLSIWENIRQSKTLIFNSKLCRHNRTLFPVEISTSFLQGDHDEGDRIFASVRDITERVASEEEKRTLERMAFHRERLATIGTLAAGVAHEINNPNNAIHFNAVMLQDIWPDLERVLQKAMDEDGNFLLAGLPVSESMETLPRMFEGIRKSSERIQSIIGNLKHLSRQEQGPVSVSIDLKMVLRETVAILQGQISRHTNHFHMEYLEQPVLVLGNAQQLEQVFINLILNALQSLPKRNLAVGVSMSKSLIPNEIQVIITDEGIGIPKENLSKLTDPFFTTKAEQDGTGLGLSIASSIITNHGGRMTFFSQEKTGTTVTVTLPTIATQKRGDHP